MLSSFIRSDMESILSNWEDFARTLVPAAADLDQLALRDGAKEILTSIANDMDQPQTDREQSDKSQGLRDENSTVVVTAALHAKDRLTGMFTLNQLVAEYRALRSSVLRLWFNGGNDESRELQDVIRFNEAIDQALAEAIRFYDAELDEARELFMAALAHDLRSPLGAIRSTADLLTLSRIDDPVIHRAAGIVRTGSHKMAQIIDDLLDFAQIRIRGTLQLERAPVDLVKVCCLVAREVEAHHPDAVVHLNLPEQLSGEWDETRLNQLLTNLIDIAINHGDGAAPIEVSAEVDGQSARVRVWNSGPPIPPRQRRAIFEPFMRGDGIHPAGYASGGMGLGLYIAHQIVTQHGGSIEPTSSEEDGTVFTVMLPLGS